MKENIEEWKPFALGYGKNYYAKDEFGYTTTKRNVIYYERNWFCQTTGIIHHSEKSVLNCPHCSKKYYKP